MRTANPGDTVVGVDHSAVSEAALRWAVSEAAQRGRQVIALRAWSFEPVSALGAAVAGSPAAEHCLREASCPLVVIPARTVPEPEKDTAATPEPVGTYYPGPLL